MGPSKAQHEALENGVKILPAPQKLPHHNGNERIGEEEYQPLEVRIDPPLSTNQATKSSTSTQHFNESTFCLPLPRY